MNDDLADTDGAEPPIFVERHTYRRRRLIDAARALPLLGLMLWVVPLLWALPESPRNASSAIIYIFGVWLVLVLISAMLIGALKRREQEAANRDEAGP